MPFQRERSKTREQRFKNGRRCPHCDGSDVIKWGTGTDDVQRYRCKNCETTFNERTKTALAGVHKLDKWRDFIACMREGESCRTTADKIGVNYKTVWRWRHRVLDNLNKKPIRPLAGIVEMDAKSFRRSYKGNPKKFKINYTDEELEELDNTDDLLDREPRHHGADFSTRGQGRAQVQVLHLMSRSGSLYPIVVDQINTAALLEMVTPFLNTESNLELCMDKDKALRAFAKRLDVPYKRFSSSDGERVDGVYHIQNVNSYHSRLENWMTTFRGVSTKYLRNYMLWHSFIDQRRDQGDESFINDLLGESVSLPDSDAYNCPNCGYKQAA